MPVKMFYNIGPWFSAAGVCFSFVIVINLLKYSELIVKHASLGTNPIKPIVGVHYAKKY